MWVELGDNTQRQNARACGMATTLPYQGFCDRPCERRFLPSQYRAEIRRECVGTTYAFVMESEDMTHSKCVAERRVGSTPTESTTLVRCVKLS